MRWKFKNISSKSLQFFLSSLLVITPVHFANASASNVEEKGKAISALVEKLINATNDMSRVELDLIATGSSIEAIDAIKSDLLKSKIDPKQFPKSRLVDGKKLFIDGQDTGIRFNITENAPLEILFQGQNWVYDRHQSADQNYFRLKHLFQHKSSNSNSIWNYLIPEARADIGSDLQTLEYNVSNKAGNLKLQAEDWAINTYNNTPNPFDNMSWKAAAATIAGVIGGIVVGTMTAAGVTVAVASAAPLLVGILAGLVIGAGAYAFLSAITSANADTIPQKTTYACDGAQLIATHTPLHADKPVEKTTYQMSKKRVRGAKSMAAVDELSIITPISEKVTNGTLQYTAISPFFTNGSCDPEKAKFANEKMDEISKKLPQLEPGSPPTKGEIPAQPGVM